MTLVQITPGVSGDYRAAVLSWHGALVAADKSPNTVKIYMNTVRYLGDFLLDRGMPTRPDLITGEHLREYLATIPTPATRRLRYQTLQTFFKYLVREGEVTTSPMEKVDAPQIPDDEAARTFLSVADFDRMLATCRHGRPPSFLDRRDLALLMVMRHSGLRRTEASDLRLEDVYPDEGQVLVRKGKGRKARISAFNRDTGAALLRYLSRREEQMRGKREHGFLWVSENGVKLGSEAVGAMVTRRAKLAKVGSVSAHELRHLFADQLKRAGASDETLMSLGGWSDAKIVGRYGRALRRERAIEEYRRITGE